MNWIAQTGHVTAKDVRHAWWSLIAYMAMLSTAAIGVASGRALGPYWTSPNSETLGMRNGFVVLLPMCTVLVGLIVTASLVQVDSPTRATAFWASRPLSPSAVVTSKIALVLVVILALPLLGQFVVIRSFDASAATETGLLAHSALSYAEWLLAAMIIGALTDDLRAFVGVFVLVLVMLLGVAMLLSDTQSVSSAAAAADATAVLLAVRLVSIAAGLALVGFIYRTHDRRPRVWAAGVLVTALLIFGSFATASTGQPIPPAAASGPPIKLQPVDPSQWGHTTLLQIRLGAAQPSDSMRLVFQADTMQSETLQGSVVHQSGRFENPMIVEDALPPVGERVRWLVGGKKNPWPATISFDPGDANQQTLAQGVKSVMIGGVVVASRPRIVTSLPLRNGASVVAGGRRFSIYGVSHGPTSASVFLHVSTLSLDVTAEEQKAQFGGPNLQFAIVNAARAEAMLIDAPNVAGDDGSIVLPWMGISSLFTRLTRDVAPDEMEAFPRDNAWYTGARLVVYEWAKTTSYRTSAQTTLPLTEARP